ncbi:MAG: type II toxin-antitoxin system HicB family antitoxin [Desulfobacteraceae bacterium]
MENKYTAVIKKEDARWIGCIDEIPGVNCQEKIKEELLDTLRPCLTLKEALEMNKLEALADAKGNSGKYHRDGALA